MNTKRVIKIHTQEVNKDGKKFTSSSAEIEGKWYKIKFTQECDNAPKKRGLYDLKIDFDDCSVEKGKAYTRKDGTQGTTNPTIWVRKILNIRKYTEEELAEENREAMGKIFGASNSDDDLPL